MTNRNRDRIIKTNDDPIYQKQLEARSIKKIERQYKTGRLYYPSDDELVGVPVVEVFWGLGDRLYKYAKKYYDSEEYWWLIAWFNKKPTEHHFKIGDKVKIIASLSDARRLFYGD